MLDKKGRQTGLRAHLTAAEMEEGHTIAPDEKNIRNILCLATRYLGVAIKFLIILSASK